MLFKSFLVAVLPALCAAVADADIASITPPALELLYTSFVSISTPIDLGVGPNGDRLVIPITGGNFTGPKIKGTVLPVAVSRT
jgi:hypothetical protein